MSGVAALQSWLDSEFPALLQQYGVPGATAAVLVDGEIAEGAAGVLNRRTGVAVTPDSVFQIGSITKLWTATLVLQLVQEGLIDLDAPIRRYLPEFRVADPVSTELVTARHLLTHTSGIVGDAFVPTCRGDDAVARYVDTVVPGLGQDVPPGVGFSYSNSGFVLLGRIAEVLRGMPYRQLLAERLAGPLHLAHWAATPEDALLHRAAVGHIPPDSSGTQTPVPIWNLPHSLAPAGTLLAMSARCLLRFAQALTDGQTAADAGHGLLHPETIAAMWRPEVSVPDIGTFADHWGLGWELFDWGGTRVVGHDGGTLGQYSAFRLVPEARVAVAVLTNGGQSLLLRRAVLRHLIRETTGAHLPDLPQPPREPAPIDVDLVCGRYATPTASTEVSVDQAGQVWATTRPGTAEFEFLVDQEPIRLVGLDDRRLITATARNGVPEVFRFVGGGDDGGAPASHLFVSGRLIPRSA